MRLIPSKDFKRHFFAEFYYRADKGFLREHIEGDHKLLLEKYGIPQDVEDLSEQIFPEIYKYSTRIEIKNVPWVKNVNIHYFNGNYCSFSSDSEYVTDENGEKRYSNLKINIGYSVFEDQNILKANLIHELLHAYENLILLNKTGKSLFDKLEQKGYFKNPSNQIRTYHDEVKENLAWCLYYLTDSELNAYLAQIKKELDGQKASTIDDAYKIVKNTVTYKNYQIIFKLIEDFTKIKDTVEQNKILDFVKELSNLDFKKYSDFKKWLLQKLYYYKRRFEKRIPKICFDAINMDRTLNPSNDKLINKM